MNGELMRLLRQITEEERHILQGGGVEKERYTHRASLTVVDSAKMLRHNQLIDLRTHTRFVRFPRHTHNYVEVLYVCSGQLTNIVNAGNTVVLRQGELLFLNQYSSHEILPAGEEDIAVNLIILPEFFDEAFGLIGQDNMIGSFLASTLRQSSGEGQYLHFKVSQVAPVQNLVENLLFALLYAPPNRREVVRMTMSLLLLELLGHTDKLERDDPGRYDNACMMEVLGYIEEHYRTASLGWLAAQRNQSPSALSRLIRRSTGHTFQELVQHKRLQVAARLLEQTGISVSDVIVAVGYDNTSYFYRLFRAHYGMSPKEYRALHAPGNVK